MSVVTETQLKIDNVISFSGESETHHWVIFKVDGGWRSIASRRGFSLYGDESKERILDVVTNEINIGTSCAYRLIEQAIEADNAK